MSGPEDPQHNAPPQRGPAPRTGAVPGVDVDVDPGDVEVPGPGPAPAVGGTREPVAEPPADAADQRPTGYEPL